MDSWINGVTPEEFKTFHGLDRQLYTILVRDLSRNPSECLQIMGFWLWLERGGFSNLISKILSLQHFLINKACDEALTCLNLINTQCPVPSETAGSLVPLTCRLLNTEISLSYFCENRLDTFHRVQKLVSDVYIPALSDIMEQARCGEFSESPAQNKPAVSVTAHNNPAVPVTSPSIPPGYASQVQALTLEDLIARAFSGLNFGGGGGGGGDMVGAHQASRFSRTMFVTFSKGYPVTEIEVSEFFTRLFGNCIESLYMQEVGPDEQSLYARIVFVNPSYIQFILNGEGKAKFSINGKHVWMRQFVPRNGRMWPCGCSAVGPWVCPHQY